MPTPTPTPTPVRYEVVSQVGKFKAGEIVTSDMLYPSDPDSDPLIQRLLDMNAIRLIDEGK